MGEPSIPRFQERSPAPNQVKMMGVCWGHTCRRGVPRESLCHHGKLLLEARNLTLQPGLCLPPLFNLAGLARPVHRPHPPGLDECLRVVVLAQLPLHSLLGLHTALEHPPAAGPARCRARIQARRPVPAAPEAPVPAIAVLCAVVTNRAPPPRIVDARPPARAKLLLVGVCATVCNPGNGRVDPSGLLNLADKVCQVRRRRRPLGRGRCWYAGAAARLAGRRLGHMGSLVDMLIWMLLPPPHVTAKFPHLLRGLGNMRPAVQPLLLLLFFLLLLNSRFLMVSLKLFM